MSKEDLYDFFKNTINTIEPVSDELILELFKISKCVHYSKGSFFVMAGDKPEYMGLNINGIFRLYYADDNGNEFTKGFSVPGKFIVSYSAIAQNRESYFSIETITESDVIQFSFLELMNMAQKAIEWFPFLFKLLQSVYIMKEMREKSFLLENASVRYVNFLKEFPGLEDKIRQYHIASFLGITPEALCRIKKDLKLI